MRNFEERKAEIFRRSEDRIKERKRTRNRITVWCVSLFLCGATYTVMRLPSMFSMTKGTDNSVQMDVENENCSNTTVMVRVSKGDFVYRHTRLETLEEIEKVIDNIVCEAEDFEYTLTEGSDISSKNNGYMIVFTKDNGNETIFYLNESVLINQKTKMAYGLSDNEMAELKKVLGIPAE